MTRCAGVGSGTKDELAAAEWVSKRFAEFGLTTAPGMKGYLQEAELSSPVLDGHATLTAGNLKLEEGKDFILLSSGGTDVSGALTIAGAGGAPGRGAVVLVTPGDGKTSLQAAAPLRRAGAAMLLLAEDASTDAMYTSMGDRTRVPVGLKDGPAPRGGTSIVALKPEALGAPAWARRRVCRFA